jgi:glycosyltransferase involved in cell wall biosynthesis
MSKKILYDGMNLGMKRGTGVATYTRVLASVARDIGYRTGILHTRQYGLPRRPLDREVSFFDAEAAFRPATFLQKIATLRPGILIGVRPKKVPLSGAVLTEPLPPTAFVPCDELYSATNVFDRARIAFALTGSFLRVHFSDRADLFHWTFPLPMTSNARANVYTVHDIVPLRLPYATLDWKKYYLKSMRRILAKADHIVTVSENSKRDIETYFGIDEKRITNTYQAVQIPSLYSNRSPDGIANELEGVFGLGYRNYILFFGSLDPKKNFSRALQAYLSARVDIPLVVVVGQSRISEEEGRLLDEAINDDRLDRERGRRRIRRYEYLPFGLLMTLIQGARAVLFPSLYEGFGLPLLEAMSLGTPVITSTTSSIPEVAGDAAVMVDPYDVDAISRAIFTLCNDAGMCAELSARGPHRAALFSIEKYRERIENLYGKFA